MIDWIELGLSSEVVWTLFLTAVIFLIVFCIGGSVLAIINYIRHYNWREQHTSVRDSTHRWEEEWMPYSEDTDSGDSPLIKDIEAALRQERTEIE